jgi:hypothetical protein
MTISKSVAAFISAQRELLDRLERFAESADYRRLQAAVGPIAAGDLEGWLAEWLIKPSFGLRELPIEAVARLGGVELVEQHLLRIVSFNG